jgi:hypothetical protein
MPNDNYGITLARAKGTDVDRFPDATKDNRFLVHSIKGTLD